MIAATVLAIASCSWAHPGADRFTGTDAAVDDFQSVPAPVRAVLRERIRRHAFDDVATITRDKIQGAADYDNLRDMHFGKNKMCRSVERDWTTTHKEVGMVYCEGEHCVIVPTVCGNIALVTRRRPGGVAGRPQDGLVATSAGGLVSGAAADESLGSLDDLPPTGAGARSDVSSFAGGSASTVSSSGVGSSGGGASVPVGVSPLGIGSGGGFLIPPSTVAAVPEPATWALLVAGVVAVGVAARRRR